MKRMPTEVARTFCAIAFVAFGIQHFIFKGFTTGRAPKWSETWNGQDIVAYISGTVLILAGFAIMSRWKVKPILFIAGSMILLWAGIRNLIVLVTTLNYGVPYQLLIKRLLLDLVLFLSQQHLQVTIRKYI